MLITKWNKEKLKTFKAQLLPDTFTCLELTFYMGTQKKQHHPKGKGRIQQEGRMWKEGERCWTKDRKVISWQERSEQNEPLRRESCDFWHLRTISDAAFGTQVMFSQLFVDFQNQENVQSSHQDGYVRGEKQICRLLSHNFP